MSAERFTLDTNILVYGIDTLAGPRQDLARRILELSPARECWLTLQAISEFYAVATRKRMMPAEEAAAQASDWLELYPVLPASASAMRAALAAASQGRASYWDALLAATAFEGGCAAILSEDMQDSTVLGGLRIVNPFHGTALAPQARDLLGIVP